tara:strand:- start:315 stop:515 length:201 start_codon:yes stop_codon:yes gene_type:complete
MREYTEQERIDDEKSELLQDLIAAEKVMEELWRYHKNNPERIILEDEYSKLEKMRSDIEEELENLS